MMWGYVTDAVYILAALTIVILFAYRGFLSSVFHFGRYIAAAMIAYAAGPALSRFLYQTWIFSWIADPTAKSAENFLNNTVGSVDVAGLVDSLPLLVKKFADVERLTAQYGAVTGNFHEVAQDFSATLAAPIASLISNLLAYVAIFLLAVLLLKLLTHLLDKFLNSVRFLRTMNRLLGALLGVFAAFMALAGVTWLLGVFVGLFGSPLWLESLELQSKLFGFFQNLNIFNLFH